LIRFTRFIRYQQRVRHAVYQTDKTIKRAVRRTVAVMTILVATHVCLMVYLEDMTIWQGIWLTLTILTTVGFGDLPPRHRHWSSRNDWFNVFLWYHLDDVFNQRLC
jgi:voltage-gated potassium channel